MSEHENKLSKELADDIRRATQLEIAEELREDQILGSLTSEWFDLMISEACSRSREFHELQQVKLQNEVSKKTIRELNGPYYRAIAADLITWMFVISVGALIGFVAGINVVPAVICYEGDVCDHLRFQGLKRVVKNTGHQ